MNASFDWFNFEELKAEIKHWIREAWRRKLFKASIASARRDAVALKAAAVEYSEDVCNRARRSFIEGDGHVKTVMAGGVVSDALWQIRCKKEARQNQAVIEREEEGAEEWCDWRGEEVVLSCYNLVWTCNSSLGSGRPPEPESALQLRPAWHCYGWKRYDSKVMSRMAEVRAKLFLRCYGTKSRRLACR